jgi:hypothetical protein
MASNVQEISPGRSLAQMTVVDGGTAARSLSTASSRSPMEVTQSVRSHKSPDAVAIPCFISAYAPLCISSTAKFSFVDDLRREFHRIGVTELDGRRPPGVSALPTSDDRYVIAEASNVDTIISDFSWDPVVGSRGFYQLRGNGLARIKPALISRKWVRCAGRRRRAAAR